MGRLHKLTPKGRLFRSLGPKLELEIPQQGFNMAKDTLERSMVVYSVGEKSIKAQHSL